MKTKGTQVVKEQEIKKSYKIIKEQEEKDLLAFINDMPTKFGLPLLKFLDGLESIK
jgi:hypothetical protein|tara:strand:- start:13863 stop:14030 length:168 start_codon:yes stop_codon:yes gene_type:complete